MVDWFTLAVISAVAFGGMGVLLKLILTKGLNSVLLAIYFFSIATTLLWIYLLFAQKIIIPNASIIGVILVIGGVVLLGKVG